MLDFSGFGTIGLEIHLFSYYDSARVSEPVGHSSIPVTLRSLYCIVLYLSPVLNPVSYDGARLYKAPGRPMLVIGRD